MHSTTLDDDVQKLLADKEHRWATFVEPGSRPNWEYCERCGRRKDDLRTDDKFLPCKGFID